MVRYYSIRIILRYNVFLYRIWFQILTDIKGTRLADKHLCPIRNMVPPTDISELRRTLGLFVVSRKYLKDYALVTKPLTDLLKGKQPAFKWESEQQHAYEYVRDALLSGIHLSAPDFTLPFHLQTDASECQRLVRSGEFNAPS